MRVRRLQSYLTEHKLLKKSALDEIKNLTLGIDALYFLRTSNELKDILSDVSGCISPCIYHLIDKECEKFKNLNIDVIFVFDGITPRAHTLFSAPVHHIMEEGWAHYVNNEEKLSYSNFSRIPNICNSDVTFLLFHYLKNKGFKCMYAPYLAISQLSYFFHINMIDLVYGPPTIILQNVSKVIVNFQWDENYFEWVDLLFLLNMWNITNEQFMDACLLAGTEYCLTFPYLTLSHFNYGRNEFNFETSIEFIKQSSLISYLEHIPNDETGFNHIEAYFVCKTLLKFPIVLLCSGEVNFFSYELNSPENGFKSDSIMGNPLDRCRIASSDHKEPVNNNIADFSGHRGSIRIDGNKEDEEKDQRHVEWSNMNKGENIQKNDPNCLNNDSEHLHNDPSGNYIQYKSKNKVEKENHGMVPSGGTSNGGKSNGGTSNDACQGRDTNASKNCGKEYAKQKGRDKSEPSSRMQERDASSPSYDDDTRNEDVCTDKKIREEVMNTSERVKRTKSKEREDVLITESHDSLDSKINKNSNTAKNHIRSFNSSHNDDIQNNGDVITKRFERTNIDFLHNEEDVISENNRKRKEKAEDANEDEKAEDANEDEKGEDANVEFEKENICNFEHAGPHNYLKVVGAKFPTSIYYLMSIGLLSKKIVCVLALGEWIDYTHPIIDSFEYRDSLIDLREYRCRILGLISVKLNPFFYKRKIKFFDYGYYVNNIREEKDNFAYLDVNLVDSFLWDINKENVSEEIKRQNISKVDLQFILRWHLYSESRSLSLVCKRKQGRNVKVGSSDIVKVGSSDIVKRSDSESFKESDNGREKSPEHVMMSLSTEGTESSEEEIIADIENEDKVSDDEKEPDAKNFVSAKQVVNGESNSDKMIKHYNDYYKNMLKVNNQNFESFLCLVYYMFLENLGIFTKNCGVTIFGLLLSEVKNKNIDNNILIIFELLKFGFLTNEPLLPANGKSYPKNAYASVMNCKHLEEQDKKSVILLSRLYSLYNINVDKYKTYDGLIDFDLCAFFAVVKVIKKTLRQLLQACVANVLITNMDLIHLLPENLYNPNDPNISGFFVTHHLMGVLTKYFLLFNFDDLKSAEKKKTFHHQGPHGTTSESETTTSDKIQKWEDTNRTHNNERTNGNNHIIEHMEKDNKSKRDIFHPKEKNEKILENSSSLSENASVRKNEQVEKMDVLELKKSFTKIDRDMTSEQEEEEEWNLKKWKENNICNKQSHEDSHCEVDNTVGDAHPDDMNVQIDRDNGREERSQNEDGKSGSLHYNSNGMSSIQMKNREEDLENDTPTNDSCEYEDHEGEEKGNNYYTKLSDNSENNFNEFEKAVRKKFPSFLNPIIDLCNAINTWRDHLSLITQLEKHTNVYDLVSDLKAADKFLEQKIHYIGLDKTTAYMNICSSNNT
ncbi:hypothetical protein, conserved [Plasmodium gonderi]|uniref:Exonuclease 1 n=1 Tax=Plasmodium gonderi TaxID=77519 RepID=A0A1Y1JD55_PLAGO|nr:hypothetical protein, conserved [Plasmodium gonderi]GAW80461.1 hypothetical protein, conserved [Plasmodium gonderi]